MHKRLGYGYSFNKHFKVKCNNKWYNYLILLISTLNDLNNIGNPVYVGNTGVGTRGAFVMRTSFDSFFAFEASCPNHAPNNCSTMSIQGQNVICSCEDFEYNLFTGGHLNRPDD